MWSLQDHNDKLIRNNRFIFLFSIQLKGFKFKVLDIIVFMCKIGGN
jgi:hypothetical protein